MIDSIEAVSFYIGLNALILLALAYNVGSRRGRQGALEPGATGDASLTCAIRAHANFAEYAPLVLLILASMAALGQAPLRIHLVGSLFTMGRIAHVIGMMQSKHPNAIRFFGNLATGLCLLVGGTFCAWPLLAHLLRA